MKRVIVRARTSDPDTSHQAAFEFELNQTKAQRSVATVVAILKEHGKLSDFEIRALWENYWESSAWSYTLPCKARHWARQAGLVKHAGYGEHEGRKVRTWEIGLDPALSRDEVCPCCGQKIRPKKGSL